MVDFGVPSSQVTAVYDEVRVGVEVLRREFVTYEQGERRCLKILLMTRDPVDDWRKRADVFTPEPKHGTQ